MLKWFKDCKTLEELKAEYKKLVMKHHPDRGGDTATMQEINAEYDKAFPMLKDVHKNAKGETYQKETNETPEEFRHMMEKLMRMEGVTIEIIGSFVWVSGNTKPHKEELKKLGFKWHSKKFCWYLSPQGYHRKGKKQYSMDEIRDMYGVQYSAEGKGSDKLTA